jgi:hypothetical protein
VIVCNNPIQINKQLEKLLFKIISHDQKIIFTGRIGSTSFFSIAHKVLKKIGGSMEGSSVNMLVKVP